MRLGRKCPPQEIRLALTLSVTCGLTEMKVWECPMRELPHSLGDLRNLKTLWLKGCEELKCLPASLRRLTELNVYKCPISELPASLGDFNNLKALSLGGCKELKRLPASLRWLTQLTTLRISSCLISELPWLRDFSNLKALSLDGGRKLEEL